MYTGDDRLLLIKRNGEYVPVGCLTDNGLSETSEFIGTTTRENGGWKTSRPVSQSYNITFAGYQENTTQPGGNFELLSYDALKGLKRSGSLVEWRIETTDLILIDEGRGYISSLSESAPSGDWLGFSGELIGFGVPVVLDMPLNLIYFGAVQAPISSLEGLNTIEYISPFELNTGTQYRFFVVAIQENINIEKVTDLDVIVGVGTDITSLYKKVNNISGYDIYMMEMSVPYSSNHRHKIEL